MSFSPEFAVQIAIYIMTIGIVYGGLSQRLKELEKKMDKHNGLMSDMARAKAEIMHLQGECTRLDNQLNRKLVNYEH